MLSYFLHTTQKQLCDYAFLVDFFYVFAAYSHFDERQITISYFFVVFVWRAAFCSNPHPHKTPHGTKIRFKWSKHWHNKQKWKTNWQRMKKTKKKQRTACAESKTENTKWATNAEEVKKRRGKEAKKNIKNINTEESEKQWCNLDCKMVNKHTAKKNRVW